MKKQLIHALAILAMICGGSFTGVRANTIAAEYLSLECLLPPPPPGGGIPPGKVQDILRTAKDYYGVTMGTIQGWYSSGYLVITELGTATLITATEAGPVVSTQTSYRCCLTSGGGGSELVVILGDL